MRPILPNELFAAWRLLSIKGTTPNDVSWLSSVAWAAAGLLAAMLLCFIILAVRIFAGSRNEKKPDAAPAVPVPPPVKEEKKPEKPERQRFFMLSDIDRRFGGHETSIEEKPISLAALCEEFRNFSASRLKLYYSIDDIRSFISGMAVSKIILMQGMSGTGKTSLAYAFGQFLQNDSVIIPVQPMWKESGDLVGYYNEFTGRFNETNMLVTLYRAAYTNDIFIVVLDEINIARVEYYFAEFLSLLELPDPQDRKIRIISDRREGDPVKLVGGEVRLPTNIWFVGTANNDDSTFAISDKVYDRSMVLNLDRRAELFGAPDTAPIKLSVNAFDRMTQRAMSDYAMTDRNRRRLRELDDYLVRNFHVTFGNRIMRQIEKFIPVYIACGGREIDALDDMVSKKVLRKLESLNPVYVKNAIPGLFDRLDELFGEGEFTRCRDYLRRIEINM